MSTIDSGHNGDVVVWRTKPLWTDKEKRRRFGYRRIGVMLERKGMVMNEKKLWRIYRKEGVGAVSQGN